MEEELRRQQTVHERTLNKPTRLHAVIVAGKVGKCAVLESGLDTLALNQLLSKQSHHLRNVLRASLGSGINHLDDGIVLRQTLDHLAVDLGGNVLQGRRDAVLQLFAVRGARHVRKDTAMDIRQDLGHRCASLQQLVIHELLGRQIRNQIRSADREASEQIELRDHRLNVIDKLSAAVGAEVIVHHVNQLAAFGLVHHTRRELAVLDGHGRLH